MRTSTCKDYATLIGFGAWAAQRGIAAGLEQLTSDKLLRNV